MQNTGGLSSHASLRGTPQQSSRLLGFCSQLATGQHCSPVVFPEKRTKGKAFHRNEGSTGSEDPQTTQRDEHKIDIGDEQSDLLGYQVFSGKLVFDKRKTKRSLDGQTSTDMSNQEAVDAKLTSKALVWGSNMLYLHDVISVRLSEPALLCSIELSMAGWEILHPFPLVFCLSSFCRCHTMLVLDILLYTPIRQRTRHSFFLAL